MRLGRYCWAVFIKFWESMYNSYQLDLIVAEERLKLETQRQNLLKKTCQWLDQFAGEYDVTQAYIFGSVTRAGKFHHNSDIDLAVETINPEKHCLAISLLSTYLERDVDLIKLDSCHFAHRIRQTGILWTKTPS
jgi:hypothetical protein